MNLNTYLFLMFCCLSTIGMHTLSASDDRSEVDTKYLTTADLEFRDWIKHRKTRAYKDLEDLTHHTMGYPVVLSDVDPKAADLDPILAIDIENKYIERFQQTPVIVFESYDILNAIMELKPRYLDYMLSQNEKLYQQYIIQAVPIPDYVKITTGMIPIITESLYNHPSTMQDVLNEEGIMSQLSAVTLKSIQGLPKYKPWRERTRDVIRVLTKHGFDWSTYLSLPQGIDMQRALQMDPSLRNAMTPKHPGAMPHGNRPGAVRLPSIPPQKTWWDKTKQTWENVKAEIPNIVDRMPDK